MFTAKIKKYLTAVKKAKKEVFDASLRAFVFVSLFASFCFGSA